MRRATYVSYKPYNDGLYFYPRSPCGERLFDNILGNLLNNFYPRSPCGERLLLSGVLCGLIIFLSTLSLRRATGHKCRKGSDDSNFYPRSPCGERPSSTVIVILRKNFYPRSPCGERLVNPYKLTMIFGFLSTLSLRRATQTPDDTDNTARISIHALLAESDLRDLCDDMYLVISIHALLAESDDAPEMPTQEEIEISIHALLAESDKFTPANMGGNSYFYPRSPCGERRVDGSGKRSTSKISIHALLAESDRTK